MQDSDLFNAVKETGTCLKQNWGRCMTCENQSPDMSPIERTWALLDRYLHKGLVKPVIRDIIAPTSEFSLGRNCHFYAL